MPISHAHASIAAAAVLFIAAGAGAQTPGTDDTVEVSPGDGLDAEVEDQREDDEDDDESADGDSAFGSFDEIETRRVRPDEVPDFRPGLPEGASSQMDTSDLPRSVRGDQMQQLSHDVASSTVELVAVTVPPEPYRATEMIYRGHALWLSPHESGEDPVLVATADWLDDADRIYAIDGAVGRALSDGGLEPGDTESQPLDDFTDDASDVLQRYSDHLVELQVDRSNVHVNLAELDGAGDIELATPDDGLVLHDMDNVMPGAIFGFSPSVGPMVVPVGYEDSENLEEEYSFYFAVDFQAILGAPIVGTNGRLIGITALRHPSEPEQTLTIPPGPIHAFLDTGRGGGVDDDEQ